jgi:[protein-PII] uridylyltransferase
MTSENDAVFAKAVEGLKEQIRKSSDFRLEAFKRFRKINEHRLLIAHNAGGGGREIAHRRSDIVDVIFRELFECVMASLGRREEARNVVVVAFGGYGRREMNPFSDVDIMFLLEKESLPDWLREGIRLITTGLWDIGFKVGHSVRSIAQAIQQANSDLMTKTSMLECRYLTGDRHLFNAFRKRFDQNCLRGREQEYIDWRLKNQSEMHARYGPTVFMQEPNIKCGCGGLRDYQNLLWIAYAKERAQSLSKLVELSVLGENECRKLERAYDFLLRVRTQVHYSNGRPIDDLTLRLQGIVATAFNYPQKTMIRRCEAFMRDYYSHTRDMHLITESAIARLNLTPVRRRYSFFAFFKKTSTGEKFDGFVAKDGKLYPESTSVFDDDPPRMMRAFLHAQQRQIEFSAELRDLISRRLQLVNRTFQYARVNREVFLAILSKKGDVGRILREMHNAGFLGRYIPEFAPLTCLVQHEFFHRYTADEHTLVCIEKLDSVLFSEEARFGGYRAIFQRLDDVAMLYLALLLHDVGKAANRRHHEEVSAEMARKVARRLQLSPERRRLLITLVDLHFALSKTAQSRNLDDPITTSEFASLVRTRQTLDALMLLTLADGMGTTDQNWSDWKESLVWQLYHQTAEFLDAGPSAFERRRPDLLELANAVSAKLPEDYSEEIDAHFHQMPNRYFLSFDASAIAEHLRLFREFFYSLSRSGVAVSAPVVKWINRPEKGHTEVWICGWDRQGLLERIAGAFAATNLNILSADVFTRSDDLVLDIFRVCDFRRRCVDSPRERAHFESLLAKALEGETFDFRPLFKPKARMISYRLSQDFDLPTKVSIDNSHHPVFTLVEIQTPDRPGLLYDLLRAFNEAGVWIELSRITTELDVAIDAFYVTHRDGSKITDPLEISDLQKRLHQSAVDTHSAVGPMRRE